MILFEMYHERHSGNKTEPRPAAAALADHSERLPLA